MGKACLQHSLGAYPDGTFRPPGTSIQRGPIVNLLGQFYPGPSKWPNDSTQNRLEWFAKALYSFRPQDAQKVYLPYKIGCGLAGGDWSAYSALIDKWASKQNFQVFIVKRD